MDFDFDYVESIKINGVVADPKVHATQDSRILIMNKTVTEGSNVVEVKYVNNYRVTGTGLHKFTDPVDKRIYYYSQFAVFHANKVFPCFDQPDLKARMYLTIISETYNLSISNSKEMYEYN